jgi:hypothetical protein
LVSNTISMASVSKVGFADRRSSLDALQARTHRATAVISLQYFWGAGPVPLAQRFGIRRRRLLRASVTLAICALALECAPD